MGGRYCRLLQHTVICKMLFLLRYCIYMSMENPVLNSGKLEVKLLTFSLWVACPDIFTKSQQLEIFDASSELIVSVLYPFFLICILPPWCSSNSYKLWSQDYKSINSLVQWKSHSFMSCSGFYKVLNFINWGIVAL